VQLARWCLPAALLLLAACPKKPPEPAVKPVEAQPPAPLLVHSFDELSVDFYPELQALEEGAPRLTELARTRDVDQWTAVRSVWGLLPVIEFLDTDRRHSALSASAGWFITTQEDGTELIDEHDRVVQLRGVNAGGRSKFAPYAPFEFEDYDGGERRPFDWEEHQWG